MSGKPLEMDLFDIPGDIHEQFKRTIVKFQDYYQMKINDPEGASTLDLREAFIQALDRLNAIVHEKLL
mgnify:FL=1